MFADIFFEAGDYFYRVILFYFGRERYPPIVKGYVRNPVYLLPPPTSRFNPNSLSKQNNFLGYKV